MKKNQEKEIIKTINDYLNGKLSDAEVDALWAEIMEHPEHYPLLKTEAGLRKYHKNNKNSGKEDDADRRIVSEDKIPWIIALAASLLVTILLNVFSARVDTSIEPALSEISLVYILAPNVTRSSAERSEAHEDNINHTYELVLTGNYEEAIAHYEQLPVTDVFSKNWINYNLGILHYNRGNHASSAGHFREVSCHQLRDAVSAGSCYWLKTNSFIAVQDYEQARVFAYKAMETGDIHNSQLVEIARKLNYYLQDKN